MEKITLSHGSGGRLMHALIDSLFMKELGNEILNRKLDSAIIDIGGKTFAFTTDSYVVNPLFFPGGDIGSLAVYGTVNDLAVCGARPLFVSLAFIIEEGLERRTLDRLVGSVKMAAKRAGVRVVTGDTKVVEKGSCDKLFINTSGIGQVFYGNLSVDNIRIKDTILVSGPVGDHAISVLSKREGIEFRTSVKSDSSPLNGLIQKMLKTSRRVRFMRDPTRGGLAATLNEIAEAGSFGIEIDEKAIPVRRGTRQACELLGLDPLYLACEGRFMAVAAKEDGPKLLRIMQSDKLGRNARAIGRITAGCKGKVVLNTSSGGKRMVEMPSGEQLPRIC